MNSSTPVESVAELLSNSGYRPLSLPLMIAGMSFEFPAAFIGESPSPDLILVADLAFDTEQQILRKVEGAARALDVVRSKRPLTVILVGPKPSAATLDAMTKVCRVLPVGVMETGATIALLENWLAVLLPLNLPDLDANPAESLDSIIQRSGDLDERIVALLGLAGQGAAGIQIALHKLLNSALDQAAESASTSETPTELAKGVLE